MSTLTLSSLALRLISLTLGSFGIFCLWASFYSPWSGLHAIITIFLATLIEGTRPNG